jgi:hypothetical protein
MQGPPGTGKTYTGVELCDILVRCTDEVRTLTVTCTCVCDSYRTMLRARQLHLASSSCKTRGWTVEPISMRQGTCCHGSVLPRSSCVSATPTMLWINFWKRFWTRWGSYFPPLEQFAPAFLDSFSNFQHITTQSTSKTTHNPGSCYPPWQPHPCWAALLRMPWCKAQLRK